MGRGGEVETREIRGGKGRERDLKSLHFSGSPVQVGESRNAKFLFGEVNPG